ncbi:non-canonical purine NTP pyrophosphatase [Spirochaeta lutea]|uniref:dITP/XTP pyrophosphatase n=1 Tax=Spirochaeta lutea TaxID=1480694 RepID=A0A098R114_9SPIO|nr:non-canonical purine NTP pyrophosphatase [Spirochaeta lutea]KGE72407.1 hypothetical protein DC28_06990 [Spirochaeta lutea]
MQCLFGSFNDHKHGELQQILPGLAIGHPKALGMKEDQAFEETGTTFFQNALGKAKHLWELRESLGLPGVPILADDSGINVKALGGKPGIYSARFGGEEGVSSDTQRNHYLLSLLVGVQDRAAHYTCCMVLYQGEDRFLASQETWEGRIATELSAGTTGFGYDPLFYLPEQGCTVAEIPETLKARISHRAKALLALEGNLKALPELEIPS